MEWPDAASLWRAASVLMLGWLAFFFGRTLRRGRLPLIEMIAQVSDPAMSLPLRRYTRRLTALWCAYFILAALFSLALDHPLVRSGGAVWIGTVLLFVGEHRLRPYLFPGHAFPGLAQQFRDTLSIWGSGRRVP